MKITKDIISIFENFSVINTSIIISPGNVIKTINKSESVMAKATITESFPVRFAIYDLINFISCLKLFAEPELEFFDNHLMIKGEFGNIKYVYADADILSKIHSAEKLDFNLEEGEFKFQLSKDTLKSLTRVFSIFKLNQNDDATINIYNQDKDMYMSVANTKNILSHSFINKLNITNHLNKNFLVAIKVSDFNLLLDDYDVLISMENTAVQCKSASMSYLLPMDVSSNI